MVTVPTAVLVHGAFTDAGIWSGVIPKLQHHGIPVLAPPNPLRGPVSDAAYVASVAAQITGPVVLVGHGYGGAVITVAGTAENVVGLVYIAAPLPQEGESLTQLHRRFPLPSLADALRPSTFPAFGDGRPTTEVTLSDQAFHCVFAADVPPRTARILAAAQRPLAVSACAETIPAAAWRNKPSWVLVAGADRAVSPELVRHGARRAEATVLEAEGASHAVPLSQPQEAAELIRDAVRATT
ncbi:alpha/beta fold hydrolase [Streptomyces sp. NPDC004629]|uniref:alpha/beta fold hydrolase n=1 Tax=Streptomyces sp. NPDC004629 TaxID=3364705 RepID=UPI0036BF0158